MSNDPAQNIKGELTYKQLMRIYCPIADVTDALGQMKPLIIAGRYRKGYQQIMDKLARAQEPVEALIDKLEHENPAVFGGEV